MGKHRGIVLNVLEILFGEFSVEKVNQSIFLGFYELY
jgi:hypothetical protein